MSDQTRWTQNKKNNFMNRKWTVRAVCYLLRCLHPSSENNMGQQCAARPKQPDKVELINTSYPLLPSTTPVKSIGSIKFSPSLWLLTDFQNRILLLCPAPQHDSYTADLPPRKSFSLTQKIICHVVGVRPEQKLTFNSKVNKKKYCSCCPIWAKVNFKF